MISLTTRDLAALGPTELNLLMCLSQVAQRENFITVWGCTPLSLYTRHI
jgi:hypothetical protein